jgi:hypothetical protein
LVCQEAQNLLQNSTKNNNRKPKAKAQKLQLKQIGCVNVFERLILTRDEDMR